jgi:hypothetical protein
MANDFVPKADAEFLTWSQNFSGYFAAHAVSMGFSATDAQHVTEDVDGFNVGMADHITARDAACAARQGKDERRTLAESDIRALARRIQASPQVTDEDRQALGLPVRDRVRTLSSTPQMRRPYGIVDTSEPFRHVIKYRDEGAKGRAKPDYAFGCEVWMKITAPGEPVPINPDEFKYAGTNSASPFVNEFAGSDGSRIAHYRLRWVSRDGTKGPWSEMLSATIVG